MGILVALLGSAIAYSFFAEVEALIGLAFAIYGAAMIGTAIFGSAEACRRVCDPLQIFT